MAIGFNTQFRINEKTSSRVIRLTDASSNGGGFTFGKGNFSIVFPDGSTINHTDFLSPDITAIGGTFDFQLPTDIYNNVLTGQYIVTYVVLDISNVAQTPFVRTIEDFNWIKPTADIQNKSDVFIPEVQFFDATSYTPIGNFIGTLSRIFSVPYPTNSEAFGQTTPSTSSATLIPSYSSKYYEGLYNLSLDVTVNYTHSSYSWLTVYYTKLNTKTYDIRQSPTQVQLVTKMNAFRVDVDVYKEKNDTQFEIMSENYDIAIALYSHLIARYETDTLDGSQPLLEELLSILEPYNGIYTYKLTQLTPFDLGIGGGGYFNISDGTNTDAFPLQNTLLFSTGNAALGILVSNNTITYNPNFGTTNGTFASGGDSRFHAPVTLGTANGLSLSSQALSLGLASSGSSGAMSAADKLKLDGIASGATANTGTVTSVAISVPSAFSISNSPITTSGTIAIAATGTTAQYIRGDGALATLNTVAVAESTNLYYLDSRSRSSISLTTTGTSGASTYNSTTGVLNIPSYQGGVTSFNTRTGAIVLSSTDVTTALTFVPENSSNKGIAGGYASLDGSGFVPATQLPSYVDDVLEYANLASLPVSGTTGKIYVTLDTNKVYRWSGSAYIEISAGALPVWGAITGTLSSQTDLQNVLDAKQDDITLTTTGTSGAATFIGNTLNIPQYQGGVTSFNTRSGAITLTSGDVTTALTYTPQQPISLTTTGTSGAATFTGNTLNIPQYQGGVTSFNTRSGAITLTSGDVTTALTYTPQQPITLTTTGTSGASTFVGNTLNIPNYATGGTARGLQNFTATAGQTVFTITAGYAVGQVDVFLNGVRLTASDFTASNGTTVVLGQGALVGDILDVLYYSSLTGYVSAAAKQDALSGTGFVKISGTTISYDNNTYLTSFTETDPIFVASAAYGITGTNITNWNTAYGWGNHASAGYLTSFTETDPTVGSHIKAITTTNISNWNTAYGWGNHASAGYLTSVSYASITGTVPTWNQNTTGNAATVTNGVYLDGTQTLTNKTLTDAKLLNTIQLKTAGMGAYTPFASTLASFVSNLNDYQLLYIQNLNTGSDASADFVAYNDASDVNSYFIDMGISGSNYSSAIYPIFPANSGYLYTGGGAGAIPSDLYIGTGTANSDIVLFVGGTELSNKAITIKASTKNVLINQTADTGEKLQVTGDAKIIGDVTITGSAYASGDILTNPHQLVTKEYVDGLVSAGLHIHEPVRLEKDTNLTATYTQGGTTPTVTAISTGSILTSVGHNLSADDMIVFTATGNGITSGDTYFVYEVLSANTFTISTALLGPAMSGLTNGTGLSLTSRANSGVGATLTNSGTQAALVVDSVSAAVNDRVLVSGQTVGYQNGVYTVTSIGSGSTNWVLTRATDANKYGSQDPNALGGGDYFFVTAGSTGAGKSYVISNTGEFVFGTDAIGFTIFSATAVYTGGTNINVSGQTISLTGTVGSTNGGTGISTVAVGDLLYGSASNTWGKLSVGPAYKSLVVNASGTQIEWNAVALNQASAVSGELGIVNGGTGALNASGARTNLGLVIGTNILAFRTFGTAANNNTGDFYLSTNPSGYTSNAGTVTSVAALTLGTTGTNLSSTVATGTTTPVITLNVPNASAANRGALTSTDWSTFNGKQEALSGTGFVKISGTTISYDNSTYLTANQSITLSGAVTGTGTTAITTTLASSVVGIINFSATGTPSATTFLRGDNVWATPEGGAGGGTPAGTTGQVQFNNAGVFGGATKVKIDANGNLNLSLENTPITASVDTLTIFNHKVGGRNLLSIVGPAGVDNVLQTHIARNGVSWWCAAGNSTTITATGNAALGATGNATAANIAVTNVQTRMKRLEYLVTTAATTAVAGFRGAANQWWMGNAADSGGFHFICRFGPATGVTTTTSRMFVGMSSSTAAPTDVNPSTLTNFFGIGYDSADANIQFMHNAATTTSKIDTGFVVPTVDRTSMYELAMFVAPNSTTVNFTITNLSNNTSFSGTVTTNLPAVNTLLSPRGFVSAGGTSSVIGIALASLYLETDY